jgi:predicted ArsR family transcriptional regulator
MNKPGIGFNAAEHAAQNEARRRQRDLLQAFGDHKPFTITTKEAATELGISRQAARTLFHRLVRTTPSKWGMFRKGGRLYLVHKRDRADDGAEA